MTEDQELDDRVREFTLGALAALSDEQYAECVLLADLERGLRLCPSVEYPDQVELVWGGAVIGLTTWAWLNTGNPRSVVEGE
jgi:hypothetical protein